MFHATMLATHVNIESSCTIVEDALNYFSHHLSSSRTVPGITSKVGSRVLSIEEILRDRRWLDEIFLELLPMIANNYSKPYPSHHSSSLMSISGSDRLYPC
jgi:hypothetical protein